MLSYSNEGWLLGMPMFIGALTYDILFFTCGALAKRGGWLDAENPLPTRSVAVACVLTAIVSAYYFVVSWVNTYCVDSLLRYQRYDVENVCPAVVSDTRLNNTLGNTTTTITTDNTTITTDESAGQLPGSLAGLGIMFCVSGIAVISISYAMVGLCQRGCNRKPSRFGAALNSAAPAAYVLHPLVIRPIAFLWQLIMTGSGTRVEITHDSRVLYPILSNIYINVDMDMSPAQWWTGFAFVLILTQVVVWPLAFGVKNIPGLKKIL